MKHVFKQLNIYRPSTKIGESYKPCQFETSCVIIDLKHISAVIEYTIFKDESKAANETADWLKKRNLIMVKIVMKDGSYVSNVLAPNMNYFGVILNDVTF